MKDAKTKWLYDNYSKLRRYQGEYIAHDENGVLDSDFSFLQLLKRLRAKSAKSYYICYIPKEFDSFHINMIA